MLELDPQLVTIDVREEKYARKPNETEDEIFRRVAKGITQAEVTEENRIKYEKLFYENMCRGAVGAGRIMSAAGSDVEASLINCFTQPIGDSVSDYDDEGKPGIYIALKEAADTMRRGGGVGYNFSELRPKNSFVKSTHSMASGPCSFIDIFDVSCSTVEAAGFRRGAQLGALNIEHPDILEFIQAKRTKGRWNNFNVSVFINDKFMKAKNNNEDWQLIHKAKPSQKLIDEGAFQREDGMWVYKSIPAVELWKTIMQSTYDYAEPGILFENTINNDNNLRYTEYIHTTNPCGEQPLPYYGCCDLGPIILTKYVKNPFMTNAYFDFDSFKDSIKLQNRFLDNVLDVTLWPLSQQKTEAMNKRRIGIGYTGLGNALAMLNIKYNSKEGCDMASLITRTMRDTAYLASIELAKEKGSFPLLNVDKYLEEGTFASRLPVYIKDMIREFGIRNSHLLSIAPTGCITPDTLIVTENGLETIGSFDNASGDQWQDIDLNVATDSGYKKANKFFVNGHKDVIKLIDNYGQEITATYNHQIRVIAKTGDYIWKRMDELKKGDVLVKCINTYPNEVKQIISKNIETYHNTTILKQDIYFNEDIAEFIGFLMANGNIKTNRHIRLFHHENYSDKVFNKIINTLKNSFGLEQYSTEIKVRNDNIHLRELSIYSSALISWMKENDCLKDKGHNIFIPNFVLKGGRPIIKAFIRGLFEGDGTAGSNSIAYTSICEKIIKDLQILLLSIGIVSKKDISRFGGDNGSFGQNDVHRLAISNRKDKAIYIKEIGFISDKGNKLAVTVFDLLFDIPRTLFNNIRKTLINSFGYFNYKEKAISHLNTQGITEEIAFSEVYNIQFKNDFTVDISVPDNVTYIANGFISHNTISLAFGDNCSNGLEPPFSLFYTRKKRNSNGGHTFYPVVDHGLRVYLNTLDKEVANDLLSAIEKYETEFMYKGFMIKIKDFLPESIVTAMDLNVDNHVNMMTAIQPYVDSSLSKCVVKGTRLITNKGLMKVEDLGYANTPDTFNKCIEGLEVLTPDGTYKKVKQHYYGGIKNTVKIRLSNGQTIEGSTEHKLMTVNGWTKMSDLNKNDYIYVKRNIDYNNKGGNALPLINYTNGAKYNNITNMSVDLALFLGMMAADGHLMESSGLVSLTKNDYDVGNKFTELVKVLFNIDVKHIIDPRNGVNSWCFHSRAIVRWIEKLIGYRSYNKHVPEEIMQGSPEEMKAFISGVSLDGYKSSAGLYETTILYDGRSEALAKDIFSMLVALGYKPRLGNKFVKDYDYLVYNVRSTNIDFTIQEYKRSIKSDNELTLIPDEIINSKNSSTSIQYYFLRTVKNKNNNFAKERQLKCNFPDLYKESDIIVYKIADIEYDNKEVYDIEVESTHDYLIDGVISHNTVNIPADYPFEDFKKVYDLAFDKKLKGIATYRPNDTLGSVLSTNEPKKEVKETIEVKEEPVDILNTVIDRREEIELDAVAKKVTYLGPDGKDSFYLIVSFIKYLQYKDIKSSVSDVAEDVKEIQMLEVLRPIEVFVAAHPDDVPREWIDIFARNLALLARSGINAFCKSLIDSRKVKSDKGKIRYGWYIKPDGSKVPKYHDSSVACIAYAIQEILTSKGIIDENGKPFTINQLFDKETNIKITKDNDAKDIEIINVNNIVIYGKSCSSCGANAVIKKDGCEFCTSCGTVGSCG